MAARWFVATALLASLGAAVATRTHGSIAPVATGAAPAALSIPTAKANGAPAVPSASTLVGAPAPRGWIPFDAYDPNCGFYVPGDRALLPEPVRWEPCSSGLVPSGASCRQMTLDWPAAGDAHLPARTVASVGSDGVVTLAVSRFSNGIYRLIADADGPVRQAVFESQRGATCTLGQASLGSGNVVYRVYDSRARGALSAEGGGAIGGAIGEPPRVLLRFADHVSRELVAGQSLFVENTLAGALLHPFADPDGEKSVIPRNPADEGLVSARFLASGDSVFWTANAGTVTHIDAWAEGQTRTLLGADPKHPADDLGTDGIDLVWSQVEAGAASRAPARVAVFTNPFTTVPKSLRPRRLGSELPAAFQSSPFVVGCGHAAHYVNAGDGRVGLRIFRLADGRSWTLFTRVDSAAGVFQEPIAVTCSEVFEQVAVGHDLEVVRIGLDSLGG